MSSNTYINTKTLEYPRHQGDIRLVYPDMGEDFILPDDTFVEVEETPTPKVGTNEKLVELQPVLTDGKWVRQFMVQQMTQEEIDERDAYLHILKYPNQQQRESLNQSGSVPNVIG